jgi:hypothetical protein
MGLFKKFGENAMKVSQPLPPPKPTIKGPGGIPKPTGVPMRIGPGGVRKMPVPTPSRIGPGGVRKIPSMKEGGMVKETKLHLLHKGEMVIPAEHAVLFKKLMKK